MLYYQSINNCDAKWNVVQTLDALLSALTDMGLRQVKLAWICALSLGVAGAAHAAGAAVPASGRGCSAGWDQLLSAEQRVQTSPNRECQTARLNEQKPESAKNGQTTILVPSSQAPRTIIRIEPRQLPPGKRGLAPPSKRLWTAPRVQPGAMPAVALAPLIDHVAQIYDIDPLLLHAIARVESRHQPGALSPAGAHGLMQVMPSTAKRFGVNDASELKDPLTNLHASARYLKSMQSRFGNDLPLVLAAYNAGEGAVERYGWRVPPYRETQDYVRKVLGEYRLLLGIRERQSAIAALSRIHSGEAL